MPSELSKIVDLLKIGRASPKPSIHIDETTGCTPSPSMYSFQQVSLSPVSRLPPELLSAIFLECAHQWRSKHRLTYATKVPHWIDVTYVCQYWRDVALDCAGLWTHLFFVSSRWMDELLRRSKSAPLIIHADISYPSQKKEKRCLMIALEHMDHVQDLWICCSGKVAAKIHAKLTVTPAPLLQSLHLESYQLNVREDIFSGIIPDLRKVHLELCHVNWLSPLFNGRLTELSLCHTNKWKINSCGFLLALSRLSNLRRLYLDQVLENWNIRQTPVKATFPQLEKITLIDKSEHMVAALLTRLEFPRSAIVRVECPFPDQSDLFQPFIMDRLGNHPSLLQSFVLPQTALLRSLDICLKERKIRYSRSIANTHGTSSRYIQEGEGRDSQFPLRFIFTSRNSFGIVQFMRTLPLARLNMFTLRNGYSSWFHENQFLWTEAFMGSLDLHIIRLEYGQANQLIRALQPRYDAVFALSLTDIQFKGIHFSGGGCTCNSGDSQVVVLEAEGCLSCLHNALLSRATAGYVLQRLYFDNCTGNKEEVVTKLSLAVEKVEWIPQEVVYTLVHVCHPEWLIIVPRSLRLHSQPGDTSRFKLTTTHGKKLSLARVEVNN